MNVVILTQDDPFFLADNLDYLFSKKPAEMNVRGCVVFDVSPFGKKESFLEKILRTWKIFGSGFVFKYGYKYLVNKFIKRKRVKNVLRKHSIPIIEIEDSINSQSSLKKIREYKPDIIVSIAGNQIFKKELIDLAPKGCLNLHTALLPKYRGLMPSFWVLKNDEEKTGVSVFFVDEGIDSGPILVQKEIEINDLSHYELIKKSKRIGMDAINEALIKVNEGDYDLLPNEDEKSSYYSFPTSEDVKEFKEIGKNLY